MNLGVQYYRPPFPDRKYWADDLARIRDSGLNTVQLWILWGWVEAAPGRFDYDDYDRLVELAAKVGLGLVLSTIAEIQPYWIHREIPGSEMIDHLGRKVISSNRSECHFGLTPGGCTDHPGVWERMARFLTETVKRYAGCKHLRGWDAWNELRWNVNADGLACFCPHTLGAFRAWLDEKYGGLDGLNRAWLRRYGDWDEVAPGKLPDRTYTEMIAWQQFITARCDRHGRARYELMKPLDRRRPITVHAAEPCPLMAGHNGAYAIDRGNDWSYADELDGVGCSSFPKWFGIDDADFGARVEYVRSAARGKKVWLSELQGGRSAIGFNVYAPVDALSQQRWIWNGVACGADTILFWCWRDEVFGRESAGFGLAGDDGLADERLAAMKITGRLLDKHRALIDRYQPADPQVGVLFSPRSYYLGWAQEGNARRFVDALRGYTRALVRGSIPYRIVEEQHLDSLAGLKLLFLPRVVVTDDPIERRLERFVRDGGTLVCESECGAFSPAGIYRYPRERFLARLTGLHEVGRRHLPMDPAPGGEGKLVGRPVPATIEGRTLNLIGTQWLTPFVPMEAAGRARRGGGKDATRNIWARHADGSLVEQVAVGKGRVVLIGGYLGDKYINVWNPDLEGLVELLADRAGWRPAVRVVAPAPTRDSFVYVKHGRSGNKRLVFVFFPPGCEMIRLGFAPGFFRTTRLTDLISGVRVPLTAAPASAGPKSARSGKECILSAPAWRLAVLVG